MRIIISYLIISVVLTPLYSQDSLTWYWQSPFPQGDTYLGGEIIDTSVYMAYGGYGGNIVITRDGGLSWDINQLIEGFSINDLEFFDSESGLATSWGKVFKTNDKGISWQEKFAAPYNFQDICIISDTSAFIGTRRLSFLYTYDTGDSWIEISIPSIQDGELHDISFNNDLEGWIVIEVDQQYLNRYLLFSTNDGGTTWQEIDYPGSPPSVSIVGDVCKTRSQTGWLSTDLNGGSIYVTNDNGNSWSQLLYNVGYLKFDYKDSNNLYLKSHQSIFHSGDNGITWDTIESGSQWCDHTEFYNDHFWIRPFHNHLYVTTTGGSNWEDKTTRLGCNFQGVYFLNEYYGWAWGDYNKKIRLFRTTDAGFNWELIYQSHDSCANPENRAKLYPSFIDENNIWAVLDINTLTLVKSLDGGTSWETVSNPGLHPVWAFHAVSKDTLWLGRSGWESIFLSCDGGQEWINRSIDFAYVNPQSIFQLSGEDVWVTGNTSIYHSPDLGITWNLQHFDPYKSFWNIHMFNRNYGVVHNDRYIYHTLNGGESWQQEDLWTQPADKIQYFDSSTFYMLASNRLLKSTDCGHSWEQMHFFNFDASNFFFLDPATAWGCGSLSCMQHTKSTPPLPPWLINDHEQEKSQLYVFPNPVQEIINLEIPGLASGALTYFIFDVSGHKIGSQTLIIQKDNPIVQIQVSHLNGGIYFISIITQEGRKSTKFIKY